MAMRYNPLTAIIINDAINLMEEMAKMGIKQTLSKGLKGIGKARIQVSHGAIITYSALLLILFIAFTVRVMPIRWEIPSGTLRLNEFDPYYQYEITNHMINNGLLSPYLENNGAGWTNYQQWYPGGLNLGGSLPSLPMTTAIAYDIVHALGVNIDVMSFCSLMAPLLGMLAVLIIYFIGKDIGGKSAGLLSALILALMPSYIQRSSLGFFDTETVGVLALLLFIYMFLRAIDQNKSFRSMVLYSLGSAGALAYFCAGWGAAYFLIGLTSLFVFVLVLMKRYSQRLLFSYSITFGLGLFLAILVPTLAPRYLASGVVLPVAGVFVLLCIAEILRTKISVRTKTMIAAAFLIVLVGGFIALWQFGDIANLAGKFTSIIDPFTRSAQPLIESVAEHRITAWGSIYYELGIGILFFLVGMYFTMKNPTNRNVFLLLFGLTTLYFASSMVRLLILLAPAFALLATAGILGILKPFYTLLREAGSTVTTKSKRGLRKVGRDYSAIVILIIFGLLVSSFAFSPQTGGTPRMYNSAYTPITVTAASLPITPNEPIPQWLNMLSWTKSNLNGTTVVSAWWDYGYWLTLLGNVTSLADNATINATQIENIGYSFMANETQSLKMLANYDAKYVLVYVTLRIQQSSDGSYFVGYGNFGDEGKWMWMARISGGARTRFLDSGFMDNETSWVDENSFGAYGNESSTATTFQWNAMGQNSTIYKMMGWAKQTWATRYNVTPDAAGTEPTYFTLEYFAGLEIDPTTAIQQYGTLIPMVCLYKINWDAYNNATSTTAP
jgi:dolichyl-diphosphooligosaccharide--protein glycosyltransferase